MEKGKYVVKQVTRQGKQLIKNCQTYREALCCGTDFRKIKHSEIRKDGVLINRFDY